MFCLFRRLNIQTILVNLCLSVSLFAIPVYGQINRINAKTQSEKIIASNPNLVKADETLNTLYQAAIKHCFNPYLLKQEQREWIKDRRDRVTNVGDLQRIYNERNKRLLFWCKYSNAWDGKLNHLAFYDSEPPTALFTDLVIGPKIKSLVNSNLPIVQENLSTSDGLVVTGDDHIAGSGCAPHLCSIEEAFVMVDKNGSVYVALLHGGKILYYKPNHSTPQRLPPELIAFLRAITIIQS